MSEEESDLVIPDVPTVVCPPGYHYSRLLDKCVLDTDEPDPPPEPPPVTDPCPATWPWPFSLVEVALCNITNWIGQAAVLAVQPVNDWLWTVGTWISDQVGYGLEALSTNISGFVTDLSVFVTEGFNVIGEQVNSFVTNLSVFMTAGFDFIGEQVSGFVNTVGTLINDGLITVGTTVSAHLDSFWIAVNTGLADVANVIDSTVGGLFDSLLGVAGDIIDGLAAALGPVLSFIWTSIAPAAISIATGLMEIVQTIADAVNQFVVTPIIGLITTAVEAILPGSPPPEIEAASASIANAMIGFMGRHSPHEGSSPPPLISLITQAGALTAGIIGMYMTTHTVSLALDLAHPVKNPGFKAAIMDIMHTFNTEDVIGPIVQAPIWASTITPLRMRYNQLFPFKVPDARWLPQLAAEGVIDNDLYIEAMSYHAHDAEWAGIMKAGEAAVPYYNDLKTMLWREIITIDQMRNALRFQRYSEEFISGYENIIEQLPGRGDLITMMVREVIDLETFIETMLHQGTSEEWSIRHYEAHWILLPLGKVEDARFRGLINDEELFTYLKLHDYKPEPRPGINTSDQEIAGKLIWKRPGRIEARWMYKWGFIDQTGIEDLLIQDGLDPEYAPIVAAATARNQMLAEINRLRDNAKKDFGKGYITQEQLIADLSGLGYSEDLITFHIADARSDANRLLTQDIVTNYAAAYLKDLVDETQLETGLAEYIVIPEVLETELEYLWIKKYKKPKA